MDRTEVAARLRGRLARLPLPPVIARLLRSDFAQKVAETFATRIFLIAINAVNTILIARLLGPDGRGQYAVAIAIAVIGAQVLSLGLQSANTYFVARDRNLLEQLTSNSLVLAGTVTVLGIGAFGVISLVPAASPVPLGLTGLALVTVPPALLALNLRSLLLGIGEVRPYNLIDVVAGVSGMFMTLALALTGAATPATLLLVAIAVAGISVGIAVRGLRPHLAGLARPSATLLKRSSAYGFRIYLATGFGLLVLKADLLVVQFEDGTEASGLYSVASSIADMLWILPGVVGQILFPRLSAIADVRQRWRLTLRTTAGTLIAFVPILAVTALVAPIMVEVMFGEAFQSAAGPLRILCAAILFYGTTAIFSQFLAARGLPWIVVVIWGGGFLLNLILNLILVPPMGIDGAALASLIAYAIVFACILAASVWFARADAQALGG